MDVVADALVYVVTVLHILAILVIVSWKVWL